ncbi:hypothetical protein JZ751_026628 [Albula glossodonta]|uniref:Uncharacterized protein n=1 Tax=Albula glossodonta TaxID=121402 RepID=A0A8T2PCK3_9TELE|nr:hypothetical protein JZ751_026628 [Albula glossodonta]
MLPPKRDVSGHSVTRRGSEVMSLRVPLSCWTVEGRDVAGGRKHLAGECMLHCALLNEREREKERERGRGRKRERRERVQRESICSSNEHIQGQSGTARTRRAL